MSAVKVAVPLLKFHWTAIKVANPSIML